MSPASPNGRAAAAPFDLEAASNAAAAEADAQPFAFTWKGESYSVPPMTAWPMKALRALAAGNLDGALGELLGPGAYEALSDAGLKVGDLNVLFDKIAADSGMGGLPNSSALAQRVSART
jgi:hypothetical protein